MKIKNIQKKYIYISPGGFLFPYLLGISHFIKNNYDLTNYNFIGSSAGSWCSIYLASNLDLDINNKYLFDKYNDLFENKNLYYKWNHVGFFLKNEFNNLITDYTFIKNNKVEISLSELNLPYSIENKLINSYNNIDELLDLCILSSYIPFLSGNKIYKLNDKIIFDGAFSNINNDNKLIILNITNDMFNKKFYFKDVLGISNNNLYKLYKEGYKDAINNKILIDNYLLF
jgi:hypothetical protein